jgi:hypothetical protein
VLPQGSNARLSYGLRQHRPTETEADHLCQTGRVGALENDVGRPACIDEEPIDYSPRPARTGIHDRRRPTASKSWTPRRRSSSCIGDYRPRGDNKEGWDNIDIFGWMGYPMQIKVNFLCRDSILAAPLVLDLALLMDLAQRADKCGIQEWLSFYYKSPQVPDGLYPEHDLFIQQTKLKNTLRHWMGEELITHLGTEYYGE